MRIPGDVGCEQEAVMKSKEEYIDELAGQLKGWAGKIDELKGKASLAKAEAKDEYEKKINELKAKQDAAATKLDELKNATGGAWEDLKSGAEGAWSELKQSVESAVNKFKE